MPNPRQLILDVRLDNSIALENFIHCASTALTLNALENFLSDNSLIDFLFLWGKKGVGKEYLVQAVNNEFIKNKKKTAFLLISNDRLQLNEVVSELNNIDLLIIENVHLLPDKMDWEKALFNLINISLSKGLKLLFTSEIFAKDLSIKLPDLKSRLIAFTAVEVPEVSDQEKIFALQESADRKGILLEERTLNYILTHTSRSLSDLLKLLADLDSYSLEKQRKLSVPLVSELLSNRLGNLHK